MIGNKLINDKQKIADAFNKFYVNIGPSLNQKNNSTDMSPMNYMKNANIHSIVLTSVTEKEVKDIVLSLNSCSPGWDFITTKIISPNVDKLLNPLVHVLNLSLAKGVFPKELKIVRPKKI